MPVSPVTRERLANIPNALMKEAVPLSHFTRFGIGGPAAVFVEALSEAAFLASLRVVGETREPHVVIGGGTNLVVADCGFDGTVVRFVGHGVERNGLSLEAEAGATLQAVVDSSIAYGLKGMQTLTGIPGTLGGAVYGNAGAYGRSMDEVVEKVRVARDGQVHEFDNSSCRFRYRDSLFKSNKNWVILSATLRLVEGDSDALANEASQIKAIRDQKYPPTMKCAGSIFKNLMVAELPVEIQAKIPPQQIREGKVASAWFLEQTNVKGLRRGDIQVARYHANLIYNDGQGTAADLVWMINELKRRVHECFGFLIEEEVQYVGIET